MNFMLYMFIQLFFSIMLVKVDFWWISNMYKKIFWMIWTDISLMKHYSAFNGITWKIIFSMNWNVLNSIEILLKLTVWQLGVGSDTRNHSWSFISSNEWGQMNELCIERRPQLTISIPCQDGGSNFLSGRPSRFFLRAGLL